MPTDVAKLKVAIVHDWLVSSRGGERVLDALCEIFPQAEIFTLFHRPGKVNARIGAHKIHTSFLNGFPGIENYYRYLLPLFPFAVERLPVRGFDLVISSSHCVAKGIIPDPEALHVSYCYTTMRYAWDQYDQYFPPGLKEKLIAPFMHSLRQWDVTSSARVDQFVAISHFVAKRIEKYYRRDSDVIYPFVDLEHFKPVHGERGDYYLLVSAFAPYKRVELAIEACQRLDRRLLIVGDGQDAKKLRGLAGKRTEFLGSLPDTDLPDLYAGARALLFPGTEDFGITPLEAMACGTPVIAYGKGGACETVEDGRTGIFFHEQSVSGMVKAIQQFESLPGACSPQACRDRAQFFSRQRFQSEFLGLIAKRLESPSRPEEKKSPIPDLYF